MKAKNLLALLAAAAMLCTAALPAYAEDTLPTAPAAVEEPAPQQDAAEEQETQQPSEDAPEKSQPETKEEAPEAATLEAPQGEESENAPVVQENMVSLNLGGNWRMVDKKATTYFTLNNGSLVDGTAENYNVKIEFKNDDCYVTLNNAVFTNASNDTNYTALNYQGNLYVTLEGTNVLPGTISTVAKLDIGGSGTAEITTNNDSGWNSFINGTQGVSIGGSVKIHGKNLGTKPVTGIYGENSFIIRDNAEVGLEGNMENGVLAIKANFRMEGGKLTLNGAKAQINGENLSGGSGIFADSATINAGTVIIENTDGIGIQTQNDLTINGGTVEIKNTTRAAYGQYGYGGNAITTGKNAYITGGTLIIDKAANNDIFTNADLNVTGGSLKLTNGAVALASYANIKLTNADVAIENISGHALSAYLGNIEVTNSNFTLKNGGFDGAVTTSGDIIIKGGQFTLDGVKRFGLHAGSVENSTGDVIVEDAEVTIHSAWPMLAAPVGDVKISGKAKITGSSEGTALYSSNNIQITGNDCEIEVTGAVKSAYANKAIQFENADELVKLGGADAASAVPVAAEEIPGCMYLHIFKGKNQERPADNVTVDTKNWTEGSSAAVPTVTDASGNVLRAVVYYKLKGADNATYTQAVPTAAGEYETMIVVLADADYGTAVYYSAFTITAKPAEPAQPSDSGSKTTTVTATAQSTAAPSAEAKTQSTPAAVTAAIPQTSDSFPYAGLAALMGAAALGMAGITVLRKKHQ